MRTTVENDGRELSVELTIAAQGANKATVNTAPVRRTREILGILRTVLFAPEDLALVETRIRQALKLVPFQESLPLTT